MERMGIRHQVGPLLAQAAASRPNWRLLLLPVLLLLLAAPVALGYDLQVVALNAFGFGWAGWLGRRIAA